MSAERVISAPAARIFELLSDAGRHSEIDGSGTVVEMTSSQNRLSLGSTFTMRMRWGVPYRVKNKVLEFEQDALIAWAHWFGHRWRYRLEPQGDSATLVRHTFDWSTARWPLALELLKLPAKNLGSMQATLERLAAAVEASPGGTGAQSDS